MNGVSQDSEALRQDANYINEMAETFKSQYEHISVPLQGLEPDEYKIYVMYQDGIFDQMIQVFQTIHFLLNFR